MERNITQNPKNQAKSKESQGKQRPDFSLISKQTALKFKHLFPDSQIYPFNKKIDKEKKTSFICHWSWKNFKGCKDIENYDKAFFVWGIKMSSVPLCVLDFDIKSENHPEGMSLKTFKNLKKEFGLNNYPCFTVGKSGQGGHFWFSDKNAPQTEKNMDFIQGLDYKVQSIVFLSQFPFTFGTDDLRELPPKFLARKKSFRPTKPVKRGRFHTQQKDSYRSMLNGSAQGIFESYHQARTAGQSITHALSVAEPTLKKMAFIPDPEPPKSGSKKPLTAQTKPKTPFARVIKTKIRPIEYIDENKMLIRGRLGCCTGEKESMKSRGLLSYLLKEGNKIGYFSGGEQSDDQVKEIRIACDKSEESVLWLDMENPKSLIQFTELAGDLKLSCVHEDPPLTETSDQAKLRKELALRADIANKLNLCWLFTRNFSKGDYQKVLNRVSGFALYTNIPRFTLGVFPIELGHEQRPDKNSHKCSLIQTISCNIGPWPAKALLAKLKVVSLQSEVGSGTCSVGVCDFVTTDRVARPEDWVKAESQKALDSKETREKTALMIVKESDGIKSPELKQKLVKECGIHWSTARRVVEGLLKDGFIEGGGRGKNTKPLKLTEKGGGVLEV